MPRTVECKVFDVVVIVVAPVDARDGEHGAGGAVERHDGTRAVVGRLIDEKVEGAGARGSRVERVDDFEAPEDQQRMGGEQVIGRRDVARSRAWHEMRV